MIRILAIIPARAGSKGIKNKNIIDLDGRPLISYTIESALKSKYIDDVIVSTDGEEIKKISLEYGAKVPFMRPKHLASDTSKTIDTVIYCIDEMKKRGFEYECVVVLQPTQPLRKAYHIDEAIEMFLDSDKNSLLSVSKVDNHPLLIRRINDEQILSRLVNENSTKRRQDFEDYYKVNGAIYINRINEKLNLDTSLNDNELGYIMDKKFDIDIDEELDIEIAKLLLEKLKKEGGEDNFYGK